MTLSRILAMTAETPIHVGIGQAAEAIDLPVAREAVTGFPHVPGSGVKGAWRVWHRSKIGVDTDDSGKPVDKQNTQTLFGTASGDSATDGAAGTLLLSEARLAMLPVRCTTDSFKLVTCPLIINRLKRDLERTSQEGKFSAPEVEPSQYFGVELKKAPLGLEEREFTWKGGVAPSLAAKFKALMGDAAPSDFGSKLVVVSDADFKWFAQYGLPVAMRNSLNEDKIVKSGALWAEETLAPDTVMWSVLAERSHGAIAKLEEAFEAPEDENKKDKKTYVQMGGNETIGQGWFAVHLMSGGDQ